MTLDPNTMQDWQIAQAAEADMLSPAELAARLGLQDDELIPMGRQVAKVDFHRTMERLPAKATARYIDVTAITPTPLGEGKTTTTMGLTQGLAKIGKLTTAAIRQPSGGPTFNIKGSAAGGGLSQCIPLTPLSIRLTGDMESVANANNLAMVALNARMQHERNYDDARLARSNLKRLDIDPDTVQTRWAIDFCAQGLRNITIGKGGSMDGFEMETGFDITAASELMAILSVTTGLEDLRQRIARIVVARDRWGKEITTADLEVDGAMTAWMLDALNPNLLQTIEGQPVFVHAGPFANIALGQSSIIADLLGCRMSDYHVTESGFGADIGYEKFWNLKCRLSGLRPDAVVIVATIRALKMHGGGPDVRPGRPLDEAYIREDIGLIEKGYANLKAHIATVRRSGIQPVVCVNQFPTDTPAELKRVCELAEADGALAAISDHWGRGGEGARELAEAVVQAADAPGEFKFLYDQTASLRDRISTIARKIYGADDVAYTEKARIKLERVEKDPDIDGLLTCMAKTHLSISHDPNLKCCPRGWILPISDVKVYKGAGLVVPFAGDIKLMPGTASTPSYRNIDVDTATGQVTGLF